MKYLKHKYSKRVYQVREDHGSEHPELVHFHQIRCPGSNRLDRFFTPTTETPSEGEGMVSIPKEIEWENKKLRGDRPLEIKVSTPDEGGRRKKPSRPNKRLGESEVYTLSDLCQELGTSPGVARRLLRSRGKTAPAGGWKWSSRGEAKPIKKILKNLL